MGARIRELRAQSGMKQKTVADAVGVKVRTYQSWQSGTNVPEEWHLNRLADVFEVTPTYLLAGDRSEVDIRTQLARIERTLGVIQRQLDPFEGRLEHLESLAGAVYDLLEGAVLNRAGEQAATQAQAESPESRPADGQS